MQFWGATGEELGCAWNPGADGRRYSLIVEDDEQRVAPFRASAEGLVHVLLAALSLGHVVARV